MPSNRVIQLRVNLPPSNVTVYTTSSTANKVVIDQTSNYPYTNNTTYFQVWDNTMSAMVNKPDGSAYTLADIADGNINVYYQSANYDINIPSNSAYGYTSTRGSFILLNGATVVNNLSKSFTAKSGTNNYVVGNTTLPSTTVNPNVRMVISAQRGGSGTDNRATTVYTNGAETELQAYANFYDYYYYYRAIDNSSRGSMSGSPANGSMNIEGTSVSTTFTPNPGYYISYINDSAASNITLNAGSPYTHTVASYANRTVTAYFGAYTYNLNLSYSTGGTASLNVTSGGYGFNSLLTYTPSYAYELEYISIGSSFYYPPAANPLPIMNVTTNTAVYVKFRRTSNTYACVNGTLKRLDMYACVDGTLKPIEMKYCVDGTLKG